MYKLHHYGIRGHILQWFKSYLYNRKQFTLLSGKSSDSQSLLCGVPQGTILEPLLFLIYFNDINTATKLGKIRLFADDSNVFLIGKDIERIFKLANDVLIELDIWFTCYKLTVNFNKTNYMIYKPSVNTNNVIQSLNLSVTINKQGRLSYIEPGSNEPAEK